MKNIPFRIAFNLKRKKQNYLRKYKIIRNRNHAQNNKDVGK